MRFTRDHLTFKALCALDEVVDASRKQPVEPTFALRFALAYLYAVSGKQDRATYDSFWRTVLGKDDRQADPQADPQADYNRGTWACTHLQGICRSVGVVYNVQFSQSMRDSRFRNG